MSTMNAAWRLEKCDLKIAHFNGRTHDEAIAQRSQISYIPEAMWKKLVAFWESPQGQKAVESDLTALPPGSISVEERVRIFKKHVGDNKNGYAKIYGLGVKVPRSRGKRCALEEERAKRIKSEEKVERLEKQLHKVTGIVKRILQLEVILMMIYKLMKMVLITTVKMAWKPKKKDNVVNDGSL